MTKELTTTQEPSVALLLSGFIEKGVTAENVAAFAQLVSLKERMEAKQAESQFNAAMAAFQQDCPEIVATSIIPNRGKYERFENIMHAIKPLLAKHGLSVTFAQSVDGGRIVQACRVKHVAGHSEETKFAVRLGGKADSETQADCKASTTAKRYALCSALNIVIHQDEIFDEGAAVEGSYITPKEAADLRDRVEAVGADEKQFLEYAKASTFETIYASRLADLHAALDRKEKKK